MRTTVDIDAVLLKRLRDVAHERGVPLKDVLNGALRRGLETATPAEPRAFCGASYAMGSPADPHAFDKALSMAAALEDEAILAKLQLRK